MAKIIILALCEAVKRITVIFAFNPPYVHGVRTQIGMDRGVIKELGKLGFFLTNKNFILGFYLYIKYQDIYIYIFFSLKITC